MCPRSSRVTLNVPPKYVPGFCVICAYGAKVKSILNKENCHVQNGTQVNLGSKALVSSRILKAQYLICSAS